MEATLNSIIAAAAPLVIMTMGETITERSGVVNLSLEGSLRLSAMTGFVVAFWLGQALPGFIAAAIVGALIAAIIAATSIRLRLNQIAVGFVLTLLAADLASFLGDSFIGERGPRVPALPIPFLSDIPFVGKVFFDHDYDITFVSWKFDEASNILPLFSKTAQSAGRYNIAQFEQDEIQDYLERFGETKDDTERAEIGQQLHHLLHEEAPYTFLWSLEHNSAYRTDTLVRINIHPFYFFTYIEEWEVF